MFMVGVILFFAILALLYIGYKFGRYTAKRKTNKPV